MADYTLSVNIRGDSEEFKRALKAAQDAVDGFTTQTSSMTAKLSKVGDKMAGIGAKMSIGLTTPLAMAGKAAVTAASDYSENLNKVDVAFGKSGEAVKEWSKTAIKEFGLSKNQALEAASLFGDMATSMGLTQPAAANMSTSLAGLAGDLASFKNIDIDQAMTALAGVFTGETESLKQLGIVMTETNLEEFAAKSGQVYSQMSQAEKVQLRYNYVMAMSKNAIGDYVRTSDGTANSIRTFQGSVENLGIAFGQNLLPAVTPIIQKLTDIVNKFAELSPATQTNIIKIGLLAAAMGPLTTIVGGVTKAIGGTLSTINSISQATSGFVAGFKGIDAQLSGTGTKFQTFGANVSKMLTSFTSASTGITTASASMGASLNGVGTAAKSAMAPFLPAIAIFAAVAAAILYLFNTNEQFKNSMLLSWSQIRAAFEPVLTTLGTLISNIISVIATVVTQITSALSPVIATIVSFLSSTVIPIITSVATIVGNVISKIMAVITPIITFIAGVISSIISVIATVVGKVSTIFNTVKNIISTVWNAIKSTIGTVISAIISVIQKVTAPVKTVFNGVKSIVVGCFNAVKNAWGKLTGVVSGIVDGIASAFNALIDKVKSAVNFVIRGINGAIGLINKIPGVEIGKIPQLAHGTDEWQGGFAYMNEGGRGELTYLPNGSQVIPHDISVKYAKEAARANTRATNDTNEKSVVNNVEQIININQPVRSPSETARAIRKQATFGLAGV